MWVALTLNQEEIVCQKVATGRFSNAEAVLNEALRLLQELDHDDALPLEELRCEIAYGIEQLEQGKSRRFNDASLQEHFEQIKAEGRKHLALQHKVA